MVDVVLVGTPGGVETCVRGIVDPNDVKNGDVFGQVRVEFVYEGCRVKFFVSVKMGVHELGVYAGIGSACAHQFYGFIEDYRNRLGQGFLYRNGIGLELPTVIRGAFIRKLDEVAHETKVRFCCAKIGIVGCKEMLI